MEAFNYIIMFDHITEQKTKENITVILLNNGFEIKMFNVPEIVDPTIYDDKSAISKINNNINTIKYINTIIESFQKKTDGKKRSKQRKSKKRPKQRKSKKRSKQRKSKKRSKKSKKY